MAVKPPTEEGRRFFEKAVADTWAMIAEERRHADRLVDEDGGVEARRKAKSIRISMSLWERSTKRLIAWVDAENAKAVAS